MKIFAGMAVVAGIPIAALYVDARISSDPSIWPVVIAALLLFIAGVSMSAGLRWPTRTLRISWFCACPVIVLVRSDLGGLLGGLPAEPLALALMLILVFVVMISFIILTGIPWFLGLAVGAHWSGYEPFQSVRQHSAFLAYVLLWLTAGLYWFYWLYRMMRDLNAMRHMPMFDVKRIALLASGYLFLYSVSFFIAVDLAPEPSGLWQGMMVLGLFLMAVGWFVGLVHLHVRIGRAILALQIRQAVRRRVSPGAAGALFFIYFGVVPYLQSHMNSIIDAELANIDGEHSHRLHQSVPG